MRCALSAVVVVMFLSIASFGHSASYQAAERSSAVAAIQTAAVAALNFRQGDAAGLNRSRPDFTINGWKDFMKHMEGFLDGKGAPTFTSSFVAARQATILDEKDGAVHLRIPGSLTQTSGLAKTVYRRSALEVYAIRDSGEGEFKIERLKQITCAGSSAACD